MERLPPVLLNHIRSYAAGGARIDFCVTGKKMIRKLIAVVIALCIVSMSSAHLRAADELDRLLLKHAHTILETLKEKGHKNVGVLKFRVKKGDEPATDRAGTLNMRLAEKLEMALVLANKIQDPIGVVRDANRTAATITGANHLTAEGRKLLFTAQYELAWGNTKVAPDAFITGVAFIHPDMKTMTIGLSMFDASSDELIALAKFDAKPDLDELLESGESFTVRGAFDQGSLQLTEDERKDKATEEAVKATILVKSETAGQTKAVSSKLHPLSPTNPDSPVSLEIRYEGVPQTIEFREGAAFVKEPTENQKVSFIVRRKGGGTPRLGIVLKVNGENTLYRQKRPDAQCSPWIFEPSLREFQVSGFQLDAESMQEFKVLSQAESKGKEINYGEFVGTISISVLKEQTVEPKIAEDLLTDEGEDFAMLTRSAFPSKPARNLSALRHQLADSSTRGLIVDGAVVQKNVTVTQFKGDSIPIMTATVKYYNPQDLPE
jgi:hypothetical protein